MTCQPGDGPMTVKLSHVPGLYGGTKLCGLDGRCLFTLTIGVDGTTVALDSPLPYLRIVGMVVADTTADSLQLAVLRCARALAMMLHASFGLTADITVDNTAVAAIAALPADLTVRATQNITEPGNTGGTASVLAPVSS